MDKSGRINIPKSCRERMHWDPGETAFQGQIDLDSGIMVIMAYTLPDLEIPQIITRDRGQGSLNHFR